MFLSLGNLVCILFLGLLLCFFGLRGLLLAEFLLFRLSRFDFFLRLFQLLLLIFLLFFFGILFLPLLLIFLLFLL